MERSTAVILLAAGASTRLGRSKQLLQLNGESLLRRMATLACPFGDPVIVVLGAEAETHRLQLAELNVRIVHNPDWSAGMGTSLRAGVRALVEAVDAVIVMVCDQPMVDADLLSRLKNEPGLIVACAYGETLGVPARFDKALFSELASLPPDVGARRLIQQHRSRAVSIPFPGGAYDLDTPEDVERFTKNS